MNKWLQSAFDLFSASTTADQALNKGNLPHTQTTNRHAPAFDNNENLRPRNPLPPKRKNTSFHQKPNEAPHLAPTKLRSLPVFEDFNLPKNKVAPDVEMDFQETTPFSADSIFPPLTNQLLIHPLANQWITLTGAKTGPIEIAYLLERGQRKSIGFMIDEAGLRVKAPRQIGLFEIEKALHSKSIWILRKLTEMQQKAHSRVQKQIVWQIGSPIDFLGNVIFIQLDSTHQVKRLKTQGKAQLQQGNLYLHLPQHASSQQIKDCAQSWLMAQALDFFTQRLNHFAPLLGVHWKQLKLSNAGGRWGSAKSDGSIRLHWRLIHFNPSIIDYVVVHELAHLRVMNHSPEFWDTVEQILPDYHQHKQQLKKEVLAPWS